MYEVKRVPDMRRDISQEQRRRSKGREEFGTEKV